MPDDVREESRLRKEALKAGEEFKPPEKIDEFSYYNSNSSSYISDIEAITLGGHSSRFWIYRKHMISMDYDVMKFDKQKPGVKTSFPFFAWQCLSIQFSTRTVDLVIKDDK